MADGAQISNDLRRRLREELELPETGPEIVSLLDDLEQRGLLPKLNGFQAPNGNGGRNSAAPIPGENDIQDG